MFIYEGRVLNLLIPMILRETQYPAGWFLDADARAAAGIVEVPEPVAPTAPEGQQAQLVGFVLTVDGWSPVWEMRDSPPPAPTEVPAQVTRRQARQALLLAGLLDKVVAAIESIPDPVQRGLLQIEWEDAQTFDRDRGSVLTLGAMLGLDNAGLDRLFIQAGAL